jgi:uncharacterized protein with PQ loop repeat
MVLPQLARTIRNRTTAGVSPVSWALTATGCLGWICYGFRAPAPPQVPGNLILVPGAAAIAVLAPAGLSGRWRAAALTCAALGVTLTAFSGLPAEYLGYLAFAVTSVATLPQAFSSVLRRQPAAVTAVSRSAWGMRAASQVCWLGYSLPHRDVPVTIAASVTLVSALVVLIAESVRLRKTMTMPHQRGTIIG